MQGRWQRSHGYAAAAANSDPDVQPKRVVVVVASASASNISIELPLRQGPNESHSHLGRSVWCLVRKLASGSGLMGLHGGTVQHTAHIFRCGTWWDRVWLGDLPLYRASGILFQDPGWMELPSTPL